MDSAVEKRMTQKGAKSLSLCLATQEEEVALLNALMPLFLREVERIGGEVVIAGDLRGLGLDSWGGVVGLHAPEGAAGQRWGLLRNLAIMRSSGRLIVTGRGAALLGPYGWGEALVEWAESIEEATPYLWGFPVLMPSGKRLWDWCRVDSESQVKLFDYGEQCSGLALGGRYFGMSRSAWLGSGGFDEGHVGNGEDIEFTHRCAREKRIPVVFCDAMSAVWLSAGVEHVSL